ncbi:MAG: DMT family transporter [Candidatus Taylorbacteria bacterium]
MNSYKTGPWLVALAAFLWAIDAPFRKYVTGDLSSTTIVFMEHLLIALLVLPIFFRRFSELKKISPLEWLAILGIALGGSALATVFFTESFSYVNPSVAILLQKIQPFVAILLATILLKEKLTKKFWLFAVLGIYGAYLVSFPSLNPGAIEVRAMTGVLLALAAAVLWAAGTVFGRFALRRVAFQTLTALRFLGALVFLFFIEIYFHRLPEVTLASRTDWLFIFIIAIIAGFLSLFIYYKGLLTTKASVATIMELIFPVSAVVINWIFLGSTLVFGQIVGGVILLCAVAGLSLVNSQTESPTPPTQ